MPFGCLSSKVATILRKALTFEVRRAKAGTKRSSNAHSFISHAVRALCPHLRATLSRVVEEWRYNCAPPCDLGTARGTYETNGTRKSIAVIGNRKSFEAMLLRRRGRPGRSKSATPHERRSRADYSETTRPYAGPWTLPPTRTRGNAATGGSNKTNSRRPKATPAAAGARHRSGSPA